MPNSAKTKRSRRRTKTQLVFDPAQKVPDHVLDAILEQWFVPALIEQFLQERGITRQSLLDRYRTLE